jgi:hypothetical protein
MIRWVSRMKTGPLTGYNRNCNWNLGPTIRLFESLHTALSAAGTEVRAGRIDEPTGRFGALRVIPGVLEPVA